MDIQGKFIGHPKDYNKHIKTNKNTATPNNVGTDHKTAKSAPSPRGQTAPIRETMHVMTQPNEERINKAEQIATDILLLSRNTLLVNLRFLDSALSRFELRPSRRSGLATNGQLLTFSPEYVLRRYQAEKNTPVRDYLHLVMHCIYQHMFVHEDINQRLWNLACDIAVENAITELDLPAVKVERESKQEYELKLIRRDVKLMTAEKIFRWLMDEDISEYRLKDMEEIFYSDDHTIWYMPLEETDAESDGRSKQMDDKGGSGKHRGDGSNDPNQRSGEGKGSGGGEGGEDEQEGRSSASGSGPSKEEEDARKRQEREAMWKDLSERISEDLKTFSKGQGDKAGSLMQNLNAVNRERYDYTSFLKKFSVMGEAMQVNDDEFDYIFYTYGLQLYENVPLIEPLEYKEVKRIKDFVIAIDTSGSTSGPLVQAFMQKTYNILMSSESFFSKVNIHIIQCDAIVQEHIRIKDRTQFEKYLKDMKIRGGGGTDFRPVFQLVDELIKDREFTNLKGLIYFTDGWGEFPRRKPDYETAFIFMRDDYFNPDVPPWAIKLVLDPEEIDALSRS